MTRKSRPTGAVRVASGTISNTFFPARLSGASACDAISRTCCSLKGRSTEPEPGAVAGGARVAEVIALFLLDRDGREAAVHNEVLAGDERRGARGSQGDDDP